MSPPLRSGRGSITPAQPVISLFRAEVILPDGPYWGFEDVEMATLEWVA
jgi:hypothetical protein